MTTEFLGMPIEGSVYRPSGRENVTQLSEREVKDLIQAVLYLPGVRGLGWTQYTPYFNDGEPCVFRVGEPFISILGADVGDVSHDYGWQEEDYEENGRVWLYEYESDFKRLIGDASREWSGDWPNRTWEWKYAIKDQPNPPLFLAYMALDRAFDTGSCESVLLNLFGDHTNVIIDNENNKVVLEEYEHD